MVRAAGDNPDTVDADGNRVLPGFHDPHVHVPEAGINLDLCLLPPGETVEVYAALLADCEAAGIGADDADPQGGILHRDRASGRLTGLLLEDAQQTLCRRWGRSTVR